MGAESEYCGHPLRVSWVIERVLWNAILLGWPVWEKGPTMAPSSGLCHTVLARMLALRDATACVSQLLTGIPAPFTGISAID